MNRLAAVWVDLRSSLWFVPAIIVLSSIALGMTLSWAGIWFPALAQSSLPSVFGFSADGSRAMLSSIATSMITVAGVAFSITIVALSLAATQYSPRVLRQFMRDRSNQVVLGVFVGVFAYCLVVIPMVRGGEEAGYVPALAVVFGVVLGLVGVGCLVYFIHHVATGIQASAIIAEIAKETHQAISDLFPESLGEAASGPPAELARLEWQPVPAPATGFLQLVDEASLLGAAAERDLVVRMERCIGEFVVAGTTLAFVAAPPGGSCAADAHVARAFRIDRTRTVDQDASFGFRQIVDAALRALSPSLNDTTTAVMCIDYLTALLRHAAGRHPESPYRRHEGRIRIVARRPSFEDLLRLAFDQIRESGAGNRAVLERLLWALETIGEGVATDERRRSIAVAAHAIAACAERAIADPVARDAISDRARRLAGTSAPPGAA